MKFLMLISIKISRNSASLTLSVPDVISGRGDVGLITLVDVYFAKISCASDVTSPVLARKYCGPIEK